MSHHDAAARRRRRALLFLPFVAIAAVFVVSDVVAMRRVAVLRHETEVIVQNTLQSITLVSRMHRDLDQVKILADRHVFEQDPATMAALEARIVRTEADFREAAGEYAPLATFTGERETWDELRRQVSDLRPPLEHALALSRVNRDGEAQQAIAALDPQFDAANRDFGALVAINRREADQAADRVQSLQRSASAVLEAFGVAGILLTLVVGILVSRAVQRREELLSHAKAAIEEKNRDLDSFAGRVAHDLRGPLSTAMLAAGKLSRDLPAQGRTLSVLERAFQRMSAIIEDLLALCRMPENTSGACDPAAAAEQLREDLEPRAASAGVDLVIDVEHATVRCTDGLLRQVIWNLADNAMKYRRADVDPHVAIHGRATPDEYELCVEDNGVGMTPEEATHVFEPFYRAAGGGAKPGTGLGLSIVKRVVEASGGSVTVSSEVGRGSAFVTHLPLAEAGAPCATGPA